MFNGDRDVNGKSQRVTQVRKENKNGAVREEGLIKEDGARGVPVRRGWGAGGAAVGNRPGGEGFQGDI